jgi:hypothetical protein
MNYNIIFFIYLGMTNLMSSAFSTIGPFGTLSSASAAAASSALNSSNAVTPYGPTPTNK